MAQTLRDLENPERLSVPRTPEQWQHHAAYRGPVLGGSRADGCLLAEAHHRTPRVEPVSGAEIRSVLCPNPYRRLSWRQRARLLWQAVRP